MVCFIHRPEYYKIYQDEKGRNVRGMAEFIIAKHRNGAVDTILLKFRSEYARFQDPDEDNYIPMPGETRTFGSAINDDNNQQPTPPPPASQTSAPLPSINDADTPFGPPSSVDDLPY